MKIEEKFLYKFAWWLNGFLYAQVRKHNVFYPIWRFFWMKYHREGLVKLLWSIKNDTN